jgi:polysaccharide biosynthesis protein PslG
LQRSERRLRRALIAGLLALAVVVAAGPGAPGAAARVKRGFYGLNLAFYEKLARSDRAHLAKSHLKTMRVTLNWSSVEPNPVQTDWSSYDALFTQLAKLGIRPQPLLYSTPSWVNGIHVGGKPPPSAPPVGSASARAAWRSFVQAAVNRYGPGGAFWTGPFAQAHPDVKPQPVKLWQIWNEPNIERSFYPHPSVRQYATVLRDAHTAIAAAGPKARIALAGMPTDAKLREAEYLRKLYRLHGIKKDFDVVAVHPYGPSVANVRRDTAGIRKVMRRAHDGRTPIWVSETSWGSAPKDGHINQGRKGQARMLTRTMKMFAHWRRALGVNEVSWFVLRDPGAGVDVGSCTWCRYAGLLGSNGDPKPAWGAFERLLRR